MKTVKMFKQGNSLCVVIPYHFRARLKLVKGDLLVAEFVDDTLVLSHIRNHIAKELKQEAASHASTGDARGARS